MQLNQLEYVLAVAKHHSFTRAAEEIKISQSSLSQQVSNLEKELGVNLFIRTTRSVYLTSVGEDFVSHAMRVMSEINATHRCIQEYVSIDKGHLTVGIIPVVGHYDIPRLLANFNREFPGVKLSLIENQDDELLEMLNSSKLDVAIVQEADLDSQHQYFPLCYDRMVLLTSARHPLALRKNVDLKELKNEKFILTPPTSAHHHDFQRACRLAGFEPNVLMTCSSVRTMLGLTNEDIGVTVLSSRVASNMVVDTEVSMICINPAIERKIYLAIRKNTDISPTLKVFVKYTAQWINLCNAG